MDELVKVVSVRHTQHTQGGMYRLRGESQVTVDNVTTTAELADF
jgi:hypothetical protein